jgi:hypothetical protein
MDSIKGTEVLIAYDLIQSYPELINQGIKASDLFATISYILDSKDIESKEGFEQYIYITDEINKLLYIYYSEIARTKSNLFKIGGLLLLLNKDETFYQSNDFKEFRNKRRNGLIKMFPLISTTLEGLQYPMDSSQ